MPHLTGPIIDPDSLQQHQWTNTLNAFVHTNQSITDAHRMTYSQNRVTVKAKDIVKAIFTTASYSVAVSDATNCLKTRTSLPSVRISTIVETARETGRCRTHWNSSQASSVKRNRNRLPVPEAEMIRLRFIAGIRDIEFKLNLREALRANDNLTI